METLTIEYPAEVLWALAQDPDEFLETERVIPEFVIGHQSFAACG
ncbi:MAG: hypothetical protein O7E52_20115 [Candidatus Poribacteria bacterium]|nr:hypothetical protein [Candidatus Poribacteria bacterium]